MLYLTHKRRSLFRSFEITYAANPTWRIKVCICRYFRKESFETLCSPFCFYTRISGIISCIYLNSIAAYLIALHLYRTNRTVCFRTVDRHFFFVFLCVNLMLFRINVLFFYFLFLYYYGIAIKQSCQTRFLIYIDLTPTLNL